MFSFYHYNFFIKFIDNLIKHSIFSDSLFVFIFFAISFFSVLCNIMLTLIDILFLLVTVLYSRNIRDTYKSFRAELRIFMGKFLCLFLTITMEKLKGNVAGLNHRSTAWEASTVPVRHHATCLALSTMY